MMYSLISFRSVTPAQRAERSLKKFGIVCSLHRTPRWMQEKGCGYSVRVQNQDVQRGVELLEKEGISYKKVYLLRENGVVEELML